MSHKLAGRIVQVSWRCETLPSFFGYPGDIWSQGHTNIYVVTVKGFIEIPDQGW